MSFIGDLLLLINSNMNKTLDTLITEKNGETAAEIDILKGLVQNMDIPLFVSASDELRVSNDTQLLATSTSYIKIKSIFLNVAGTVRVSFEGKSATVNWSKARIYINGVPVGTERSMSTTTYTTFTEDFSVLPGDIVELWGKNEGAHAYVQNFRIKFDVSRAYGG